MPIITAAKVCVKCPFKGIKKVNQENQELKVTLQRSVRREECVRNYASKKVRQKSAILGNAYTGVY